MLSQSIETSLWCVQEGLPSRSLSPARSPQRLKAVAGGAGPRAGPFLPGEEPKPPRDTRGCSVGAASQGRCRRAAGQSPKEQADFSPEKRGAAKPPSTSRGCSGSRVGFGWEQEEPREGGTRGRSVRGRQRPSARSTSTGLSQRGSSSQGRGALGGWHPREGGDPTAPREETGREELGLVLLRSPSCMQQAEGRGPPASAAAGGQHEGALHTTKTPKLNIKKRENPSIWSCTTPRSNLRPARGAAPCGHGVLTRCLQHLQPCRHPEILIRWGN